MIYQNVFWKAYLANAKCGSQLSVNGLEPIAICVI